MIIAYRTDSCMCIVDLLSGTLSMLVSWIGWIVECNTVGVAVDLGVHFAWKGGDLRHNKCNNLWDDYTDKDFVDDNS